MFTLEELEMLDEALTEFGSDSFGSENAEGAFTPEAWAVLQGVLSKVAAAKSGAQALAADHAVAREKPETADELEEALSAGKPEALEQRAERWRVEARDKATRWDRLKGLEAASRVVDPSVWGDAAPLVVMRYADRFAEYLRTGRIPENASERVGDWS